MTDCTCDDPGHRYEVKEYANARRDANWWREKAQRSAAEVERLKLEIQYQDHRDKFDVYWLQGKVLRQAKELEKLQRKKDIKKLKEQS